MITKSPRAGALYLDVLKFLLQRFEFFAASALDICAVPVSVLSHQYVLTLF